MSGALCGCGLPATVLCVYGSPGREPGWEAKCADCARRFETAACGGLLYWAGEAERYERVEDMICGPL